MRPPIAPPRPPHTHRRIRVQQDRHQVRAIVHRDVRLVVDRRQDVLVISVIVLPLDGVNRNALIADEAGGDVVLGGEGIRCLLYTSRCV